MENEILTEDKKEKTMLSIFYIIFVIGIGFFIYYNYINKKMGSEQSVLETTIELKYGESHKIELNKNIEKNETIEWTSSNPELVIVDENGNLSIVSNRDGTAIITATTKDNRILANVTIEIIKVDEVIHITGMEIDKNEINLKYGETAKIKTTITPDNATNKEVIWTSSNTSLVSVDNKGNIKAIGNKDGSAIITVKTTDGEFTKSATVTVKSIKVTGVKLDKSAVTLKYGETAKLTATVSPSNAANKTVTWTSSNPELVSADSLGTISTNSNKNGEATITAKTSDGGYTASVKVIVKAVTKVTKVTGVKLNKSAVTLKYGETSKLTATVSPSNATNKTITWTNSDPNLVSIDSKGNIKAIGNKDGTTTITVKTKDGGYTASVKVTVKAIKVNGIKLDKSSATIKYGKTLKLTATISPTNAANKTVTWTSSNTKIATVSSDGTITAVDKGKATITATTKDGSYKATCTVTVDRKTYTVTFNANGGTSVAKQSILEGEKVKKPSSPKKTGYKFNGWLLNNSTYDFNTKVSSNITLAASWIIDYKAVDYCEKMSQSYKKDSVVLKKCIEDVEIWTTRKSTFMQNFSITSNYIYFSAPLNGAWISGYTKSDLDNQTTYNTIVDSNKFEKISSVFITRIDKNNGNRKTTEYKYSGHGQGFDATSGNSDMLYLTAIAHPMYSDDLVGAASSGIAFTSFKENGGIRAPGITIAFNEDGGIYKRIVSSSSSFMTNDKFDSEKYYKEIKKYGKSSSLIKNIISMATDENNDRLAYAIGSKIYIYPLSKVKNGTATGYTKKISTKSNQGIELSGNYLYVVTNSKPSKIGLYKYNISTSNLVKSIEMDLKNLYADRLSENRIEAEGISIYNDKLYLGVVSRKNGIGYNDIYLVEGF